MKFRHILCDVLDQFGTWNRRMSQNQLMQPPGTVKRKAIDASGVLGSLYDYRKDCLLRGYNRRTMKGSWQSLNSCHCALIQDTSRNDFNLLKFIDIEDELRINLLLNLTTRVGIAAFMNGSHPIDQQTRILYYSYKHRREKVCNMDDVSRMLELSDRQRIATHVITAIDFGLDLVAIIQLRANVSIVSKIDAALERICLFLRDPGNYSTLTKQDEDIHLLEKNTTMAVCSNTSKYTSLTRISDLLYQIVQYKHSNFCQPITYYLSPTKGMHPQYIVSVKNLSPTLIDNIERCLLQLKTSVEYLKRSLNGSTPESVYGSLLDWLRKAEQQRKNLKNQYVKQTERISRALTEFRSDRCDILSITSVLHDHELEIIGTAINLLTKKVKNVKEKNSFIPQSQHQLFQSNNQSERHPPVNNSATISETTHRQTHQHSGNVRVNYTGNNETGSERRNTGQELTDDIRNNLNPSSNPENQLYPGKQLQEMMSSMNDRSDKNPSRTETPSASDISEIPILPTLPLPTTGETINILLLGETGVGKSTFINAFVNYLSFDTFEQAELNKPVVLIPVSFLMTVGANFDERIVKFGEDTDKSKNEDFDHPGQSVTQHCKSYVFYLNDGKKLCIIDTPGFGDTRGVEQDDRNMQNILEYINNLSHLNAVCFLLKPNSSRLNIFFRSCLMQILDLLGANICKNLTFCFTNARSTFYSPGDTAPLLKSMLKSLTIGDIPFAKENTFCFDSESFRYLVALTDGISFKEEDKQEYAMSWSISVKESNRLIDYVRTKLVLYPQKSDWQSPRHAQFEIMFMIRPMLEAMRNNFRNTILQNTRSFNKQIVFNPRILHRPAFLCYKCKQENIPIEGFRIANECPHGIQGTCLLSGCSCAPDQHTRIYHLLEYQSMNVSTNKDDGQNTLLEASAIFAYFLVHILHSLQEDPFDAGLKRMIIQENDLCDYQNPNNLNSQLVEEMTKLQQEYEIKKRLLESKGGPIPLADIYHCMDRVRQLPVIKVQMYAIEQGREILMKQHENEHQEI